MGDVTLPIGRLLTLARSEVSDGHLTYHYQVAPSDGFIDAMANLAKDLYVPRSFAAENPDFKFGDAVTPDEWTVQLGDFGEMVAYVLMSRLHGAVVPYIKLHTRMTKSATLQGPDTLAALVRGPSDMEEILLEAKASSKAVTSRMLRSKIENGLRRDGDLLSSWLAAVRELGHLPEKRRLYAYQVARELAARHGDRAPYPLKRHGTIVCEEDRVDGAEFFRGWPTDMPGVTLHVVEIRDLPKVVRAIYSRLAPVLLSDVIEAGLAASSAVTWGAHVPGNQAPLASGAAEALPDPDGSTALAYLVESACWYLSDHDGYGRIAAKASQDHVSGPTERTLSALLAGDLIGARKAGSLLPAIQRLLEATAAAWSNPRETSSLRGARNHLAADLDGTELLAAQLTAAAVEYRLERHPALFIDCDAACPAAQQLMDSYRRRHIRALWPGQAAALEAGLLNRKARAFTVQMPTSAGKTCLIEMLAASALDGDPTRLVIVLAPSRALVVQHTRDLRRAFERSAVNGVYGGYEVDDTDTDIDGNIVVMTPERFDLESRRDRTDVDGIIERTQLVIVDEAHLLADFQRGPRLEMLLGRAMRTRECRIVMLSSQLGDTAQLLSWLGAEGNPSVESEWRPAPLERGVYYPLTATGVVWWEHLPDPEVLVAIDARAVGKGPNLFSTPDDPIPSRNTKQDQGAALTTALARHGLVLVFVGKTTSVLPTATAIATYATESADERLLRRVEAITPFDAEAARLLRLGVGVHHRGLHSEVRRIVETAAKDGLLSAVVCTSTLAEGVDLPVATVVITTLQLDQHSKLTPSKLANLSGRAGRGGAFRCGRVVVQADDVNKAERVQKLIARSLPPTTSALKRAFDLLITEVRDGLADNSAVAKYWEIPDDLILEALEDVVLGNAEIRRAVEEALGRTLYATEQGHALNERLVDILVQRAGRIAVWTPDAVRRTTYRRTGLPFAVCRSLEASLVELEASAALGDLDTDDALEALVLLAATVACDAGFIRNLVPSDITAAALPWVRGEAESELVARLSKSWGRIQSALDQVVPWYLSGAVGILGDLRSLQRDERAQLHRTLAVSRIRYGAPDVEVCKVIRGGLPRHRALALHAEYLDDPPPGGLLQHIPPFSACLRSLQGLTEDDRTMLGYEPSPAATIVDLGS